MNNDSKKKKVVKDKFSKDFKLYNVIMGNIWKFIATVLLGVCLGYLTTRKSKEENNYMLLFIVIFFIIGVINFFLSIYKEVKRLEKREEMRKKLENKTVEEQEDVIKDEE